MASTCKPWAKYAFWIILVLIFTGLMGYMIAFEVTGGWWDDKTKQLEFNSRMFTRTLIILVSAGLGYMIGYKASSGQFSSGTAMAI